MRWKRLIIGLPVLLIAVPAIYFLASMIGAIIPGTVTSAPQDLSRNSKSIYLLTNFLHADIAIPVNKSVLEKFDFLRQSGMNLDHPDLQYLVFGWGSREFYTTAGTYSDISLRATLRAITGDSSVMHIVPAGGLSKSSNSIPIEITEDGFERLLNYVQTSFNNPSSERPNHLENESHGYGDVFYMSNGNFNIFNPCNVWTGNALKIAGVPVGKWTPTTISLKFSLFIHR